VFHEVQAFNADSGNAANGSSVKAGASRVQDDLAMDLINREWTLKDADQESSTALW
jgi:hypothetical protein